ncbi:unnamed protein product [Caenorhabditis angaria]|uniref:Uncharacterized protein n=1 Tax=Caenorhabditis angaria TaxID=860376 RepID=A0A9P1J4L1_9PELO|nr:unnamed protein product [Caenorhabditis angaria]
MHFQLNGMQYDMGDMQEWSTDMITPITSLLKFGAKISNRLNRACRRNDEYHVCLKRCPDGKAKEILITGQNVWMNLCEHYKNDTEFRNVVIPCWSDFGVEISGRCESLAKFLQSETQQLQQSGTRGIQESLESLCKSMHDYDKCFVEENFSYCGDSAAKFLTYLNHISSNIFMDLLEQNLKLEKTPKSCSNWINHRGMSGWQKTKTAQRKLRNTAQLPFFAFLLIIIPFIT